MYNNKREFPVIIFWIGIGLCIFMLKNCDSCNKKSSQTQALEEMQRYQNECRQIEMKYQNEKTDN